MTPRPQVGAQAVSGVHVLVDDGALWQLGPVEQARAACDGGAAVVQLRAKRATDRETLAWAAEIRRITRACGALFVINDRFDLAIAMTGQLSLAQFNTKWMRGSRKVFLIILFSTAYKLIASPPNRNRWSSR